MNPQFRIELYHAGRLLDVDDYANYPSREEAARDLPVALDSVCPPGSPNRRFYHASVVEQRPRADGDESAE